MKNGDVGDDGKGGKGKGVEDYKEEEGIVENDGEKYIGGVNCRAGGGKKEGESILKKRS